MRRLLRWLKRLLCHHAFVYDGVRPGEGLLVVTRCVRCNKREFSHQRVGRRVGR